MLPEAFCGLKNKFECAFLPTTTCPLPESLIHCRGRLVGR
jgi:hypothetical protein